MAHLGIGVVEFEGIRKGINEGGLGLVDSKSEGLERFVSISHHLQIAELVNLLLNSTLFVFQFWMNYIS